MNKSLVTNLVGIVIVVIGYISPVFPDHILAVGLFATSGAITNWLAIHMLFEKVPGLYGSGVIPSRFEEFKTGIHALIMNQFFTAENVANFFAAQTEDMKKSFNPDPVLQAIDFDRLFARLVEAIISSPFGSMLGFVGGPSALQPLKEPFVEKVQEEIRELLVSPHFLDAIQDAIGAKSHTDEIIEKVDAIVVHRLNELTPEIVKGIIQDMIRKHLGWLVVWGGVFGGLIGLATSIVL
ncbi:MAG: DUF445 domain-containing protein [Candidatus Latescibacteria bacterium]|jgi:uncharacterized membrane protein YheB (UPF0754 family)|nr:DUF445 domain-containing protein [Candidatus Latescibacterota bacterium]MBT4141073.1 DUF445 domain-containing protein [Candidatus Latescibacterota bacterium]